MCNFIIYTDKEEYEKRLTESQDHIRELQGRFVYGYGVICVGVSNRCTSEHMAQQHNELVT